MGFRVLGFIGFLRLRMFRASTLALRVEICNLTRASDTTMAKPPPLPSLPQKKNIVTIIVRRRRIL